MQQNRIAVLATIAVLAPGCALRYGPATETRPEPSYVPVAGTPEQAWDAAVDFLIDNGINFDFISAEMRLAKISALLTEGPILRGPGDIVSNPEASIYADCGTRNDRPRAGWGRLVADIAVRVRAYQDQTLVKVVIPRMYQEEAVGVEAPCVSSGAFERMAIDGIRERLTPIVGSGAGQ